MKHLLDFLLQLNGAMLTYLLRVDTAFFLIYQRLNTTGFLTVEKSKLGYLFIDQTICSNERLK